MAMAAPDWDTRALLQNAHRLTVKDIRAQLRVWLSQEDDRVFLARHWLKIAANKTSNRTRMLEAIEYAHNILETARSRWEDLSEDENDRSSVSTLAFSPSSKQKTDKEQSEPVLEWRTTTTSRSRSGTRS